ncbi:hypothetical protein [Streptomyces sp. NPDC008001]|uniref:hypothetical protein n=1 Tax=Streptomyces sp. NPDC008001 TaxID=3364804 RepID=UPI0036E0119F
MAELAHRLRLPLDGFRDSRVDPLCADAEDRCTAGLRTGYDGRRWPLQLLSALGQTVTEFAALHHPERPDGARPEAPSGCGGGRRLT